MKHIWGIKELSLSEFGISANAILGIRDSGKTYAGCEAAEELFEAGVPGIAFDPIGKWHSLRVPAKGGKGFPFVVAGGKFADLPLNRKNAGHLVRGAMKDGISLVLDLFDRQMTKSDWRYIVQECAEILLYENEDFGLRHVFIEEAGEFVPQRMIDGAVFSAVEKMVRMGGNSKLGCTLIHQRPADLNKSVLELCANVMLLKQSGKNTLTDLKKWADLVAPDQAKQIGDSLPNMLPGQGWAFIAGHQAPVRFKVPPRKSKHPDRREAAKEGPAGARQAVPATKFVEAMKTVLAEKEAPKAPPAAKASAKAPAPAGMSQRERDAIFRQRDAVVAAAIRAESALYMQEGRKFMDAALAEATKRLAADLGKVIQAEWDKVLRKINTSKGVPQGQGSPLAALPAPAPTHTGHVRPARPRPVNGAGDGNLPKGEQAVLTACAQRKNGCTRTQLTLLTGYKRSTRDAFLQRLAAKGLLDQADDRFLPTNEGLDALGPDFEPLPTGEALQQHLMATLPAGEAAVLKIAIEFYDAEVSREEIERRTSYARSTRDAFIQRLAARELVTASGRGIKASADLFT
jgi:uncharacterized membrane protein